MHWALFDCPIKNPESEPVQQPGPDPERLHPVIIYQDVSAHSTFSLSYQHWRAKRYRRPKLFWHYSVSCSGRLVSSELTVKSLSLPQSPCVTTGVSPARGRSQSWRGRSVGCLVLFSLIPLCTITPPPRAPGTPSSGTASQRVTTWNSQSRLGTTAGSLFFTLFIKKLRAESLPGLETSSLSMCTVSVPTK